MKIRNLYLFFLSICLANALFSHPMPNTLIHLGVKVAEINMQIQMPVTDFEIAFKDKFAAIPHDEIKQKLAAYFQEHCRIEGENQQFWQATFLDYHIHETTDAIVGKYSELIVDLSYLIPKSANNRDFTLHYDAIIHAISNHKALINISEDWENGIQDQEQQLGIIEKDIPTNTLQPLHISLQKGSNWKGFKSMFALGMRHISEGTDHLMFVLVLLLPATLLTEKKKWGNYGGIGYSLKKLLHIVTAFTLGHSLTLLVGAVGWLSLPSQPVEILIAFSIFISAIHAIYPLFYGKEILIAGGFGLVHGLAFAGILKKFQLGASQLALSVLGFNLGIEWMQLLVVLMFIPSILILSHYSFYKYIRIAGAVIVLIASFAWMTERVSNTSNILSESIEKIRPFGAYFALALLLFAIIMYWKNRKKLD